MTSDHPPHSDLLDFNLRELMERWPTLVSIFVAHRPLCIGCTLSEFHTARIAADVYGDDPEQFINAVLKAAAKEPTDSSNE